MKYLLSKFGCFFILIFSINQTNAQRIHINDVTNFWKAYDKIQKEQTFDEQLKIINADYLKPASNGLKEMCEVMNYTDSGYVNSIIKYPKFWNSLRHKTASLAEENEAIYKYLQNLKTLYPNLQPANLYLCFGLGNAGGRPLGRDLVIGLELALGDSSINTSEFESQAKKDFYKYAQTGGLAHVAIHEYIHTQQKTINNNYVLKQSIREGACDFLSELVLNKELNLNYIKYGYANYYKTLAQFKIDLLKPNFNDWFYNDKVQTIKDLGYFVGYDISKKYYQNNIDKAKAISEIIDLDYTNDQAIFHFLNQSKIFKETLSYQDELKLFQDQCPTIESIIPLTEDDIINSDTKKLGIVFTKPMAKGTSIKFSEKGRSYFPFSKIIGFDDNEKIIWLELEIEKNKEYEFVVTDRGFQSKDGFPLRQKEYIIKFSTEI